MDLGLSGKTAVVTSGSTGMGCPIVAAPAAAARTLSEPPVHRVRTFPVDPGTADRPARAGTRSGAGLLHDGDLVDGL